MLIEVLMSALLLIGAFFALVGSIGLARLPDFFSRLHAPTKASTLGIGGVLVAAILEPLRAGGLPGLHVLLLTVFVFISAPVSAHLLSLAALRAGAGRAIGQAPESVISPAPPARRTDPWA